MTNLTNLLLKICLLVFLLTGLIGLYFLSTEQRDSALLCAKVGGFASMVYTTITIADVLRSPHLRLPAKLVWTIALIAFQILAAIWYYLSGRGASHQPQQSH